MTDAAQPTPDPTADAGNDEPRELSDEELDLVGGGFQLHVEPSENEPFNPGTYNV